MGVYRGLSGLSDNTLITGLNYAPAWGTIVGTLSDQVDLQAALDTKTNTGHFHTETDILDLGNYALAGHTHEGTAILATAVTDGFVLTADGAGNAGWEVASGGASSPLDLTDTTPTLRFKETDTTDQDFRFDLGGGLFSLTQITDANGFGHTYFNINDTQGRITLTANSAGTSDRIVLNGQAQIDLNATTINATGAYISTKDIVLVESADHSETPTAARGQFWVRNDTPNVPVFTDDAGTDHVLTASSGSTVLLETWTPASEASKTFSTADFASYRKLILEAEGLTVATDGTAILLQFVDDTDTVYTTTGYEYTYMDAGVGTLTSGTAQSSIIVSSALGSGTDEGASFEIKSLGFNSVDSMPSVRYHNTNPRNVTGAFTHNLGVGAISDLTFLTKQWKGYHLSLGAGNFGTVGTVRFYGVPY